MALGSLAGEGLGASGLSVLYQGSGRGPIRVFFYENLVEALNYPKGPSTQTVGFQGPKTIQSMDFAT